MKTEKERMLKALVHINDIQTLIQDNKFEKYLQDHLIVVEYELQRQIDNLQKQLTDLNDLKEMFRLPKVENKDRKYFEVDETE